MTPPSRFLSFQAFVRAARAIEVHKFAAQHSHPALVGLERAQFEAKKYEELIALGRQADNFKSVQTLLSKWERKLKKSRASMERFISLKSQWEDEDTRWLRQTLHPPWGGPASQAPPSRPGAFPAGPNP